ncbi:MAG: uracil-DNA glycosylase [Ruminococcus sp.]|nr:uracil-DNA glycosylase [Candidatus Apopatosoma intestinale]
MEVKTLEEIRGECESCRRCPLSETRTNVVFGTGNPRADLMFVGEAPGESEDLSGVPFVGRAGKLFDQYLEAVGIERNDVYIANILKCRPPKNRDPLPDEEDLCIGYLRDQVRAVSPKLIVCLGRIAAMRLIKPDFKITAEHGVFAERGPFRIAAVYHPSALLRDPSKRGAMLADMLMIRDELERIRKG